MIRRNVLSPSSGSKSKPNKTNGSKQQVESYDKVPFAINKDFYKILIKYIEMLLQFKT
jgi:hypothetical protein